MIDLNGGGTGPAGSTFTVNGTGFGNNAAVTVYFDGQPVGSATASSQGVFTATATVPSNATPGPHNVVAWNREGEAGDSFVVTGGSPTPAPSPGGGDGGPGNGAPGGSASGGSPGTAGAPGSSSGRTSGGNSAADGRESGRVSGGDGSRSAERGSTAEIGGPTLATTDSGEAVFADSLPTRDQARKAAAAKGDPSARTASGDLWSGFASDGKGARGGLADGGVPANGPGSGLTLSLALAGLGLTALMAGAGATALRRRRALARRSSD